MSTFLQIQPNIFCENCKECGARPVIQQTNGKYMVICPNDKTHYRTKAGLIDLDDWNLKNKKQKPFVITPATTQKAS